jgi:hypothetical protein
MPRGAEVLCTWTRLRLRRADYERAVVEEAARRSDERVVDHEVAVHAGRHLELLVMRGPAGGVVVLGSRTHGAGHGTSSHGPGVP